MPSKQAVKDFVIWYLRQPFVMIVWFMETFAANRARLKAFMAEPRVASWVKTIIVATFFVWLLVFAFVATQEGGDRFTCAVKSLWPDADLTGCEVQPWDRPATGN
ncbi:MAG: hypothetical protein MJA30_27945 [Cytophagales bacterium]|nr:hypothetical protein [Cytophagales bacterium]